MSRSMAWCLLAWSLVTVDATARGQIVAEALVDEMCAPTLTGSDKVKDAAKLARAEEAAKKVIALRAAAVPALIARLGVTSPPVYAREALAAIGADAFPAIRKELANPSSRLTRGHLLSAIARMGVAAEPLVPDLLAVAEDPQTKHPGYVYEALVQIASDRRAMMDRYVRHVEAHSKTAVLDPIADLFRILNGRELGPLIPACKTILDAQGIPDGFKWQIIPLSHAGPEAAPLLPAVIEFWEQQDNPEGDDALKAIQFLACVGPHAESKRVLPKLNAWLVKSQAERSSDLRKAAWLATAIACIEGKPASAVPAFLEYGQNFASRPNDRAAWWNFSAVLDVARPVAYHDSRAAARMVGPLIKALEVHKNGSHGAETTLRAMGCLPRPAIKSVAAVAVYDPQANEILAGIFRGRCVRFLSDHAMTEPLALEAIETIAAEDRNLAVRNAALAAIRYVKIVSTKAPRTPTTQQSDPTAVKQPDPPVFRTWTSSNGKFTVMAKIIAHDATTVTLQRKRDDKIIKVPLEKLSADDRAFVKALR